MHHQRTAARIGAAAAAGGLLTLSLAAPASAHVTITPSETAAGAYTVLTVSNGHGCEGSPTTKITISMPEEVLAVTPTRHPLYEVDKQMAELDEPVTDTHGNSVTERVDTVTYTAEAALPDGYRDAFELSLQLPDTPGETLVFPVIQTCEQGETAWVETPAAGQDAEELERPAPTVTITKASAGGHGGDGAASETSESSEATEEPETSESSESSESASPDAPAAEVEEGNGEMLGMAGLGVGALGLLVGGVALARVRRST